MNIRTLACRLAVAAVGFASMHAAFADEAEMVRAKKCMSCHALDQKLVGPAYREVAARYANDGQAQARLSKKIREGGAGAWGQLAMAPNSAVTDAEARTLAAWVLSLK